MDDNTNEGAEFRTGRPADNDVTSSHRPVNRSTITNKTIRRLAAAACVVAVGVVAALVLQGGSDGQAGTTPSAPQGAGDAAIAAGEPADGDTRGSIVGGADAPARTIPGAIEPTTTEPTTETEDTAPATTVAPTTIPSTTAPPADVSPLAGGWTTEGRTIVDADGDPVQLRGINWHGFDAEDSVAQGLWVRNWRDIIDQIADLGFNAIRLPFSSAMLDADTLPDSIDESINPDLAGLRSIEVMDRIIDYSADKGLVIVLARHTLDGGDTAALWYNDDFPAERLVTDWQFLADRYGERPNVVAADLYDSIHAPACWGCGDESIDWHLAAQNAANALHDVAPRWLAFVGGVEQFAGRDCADVAEGPCSWWGSNLSGAAADPVVLEAPDKLVYTAQEFGASVFRQSWFDDPAFPANLPPLWEQWWGGLASADAAPVVLGAFGGRLDTPADEAWFDTVLAYANDRDIGFAFWALSPNADSSGGLLADDWTTVDPALMSRLQPHLSGPFD